MTFKGKMVDDIQCFRKIVLQKSTTLKIYLYEKLRGSWLCRHIYLFQVNFFASLFTQLKRILWSYPILINIDMYIILKIICFILLKFLLENTS